MFKNESGVESNPSMYNIIHLFSTFSIEHTIESFSIFSVFLSTSLRTHFYLYKGRRLKSILWHLVIAFWRWEELKVIILAYLWSLRMNVRISIKLIAVFFLLSSKLISAVPYFLIELSSSLLNLWRLSSFCILISYFLHR